MSEDLNIESTASLLHRAEAAANISRQQEMVLEAASTPGEVVPGTGVQMINVVRRDTPNLQRSEEVYGVRFEDVNDIISALEFGSEIEEVASHLMEKYNFSFDKALDTVNKIVADYDKKKLPIK